ncbi:DUF2790 domain-containing protein [Rhodococcus sp. IEGM1300]
MRFASMLVAAVLMVGTHTAFAKDAPETQDKLDIKEVVRVDPIPFDAGGIIENTMVYKNSAGELKELKYKVMGNGCQGG